MMIERTSIIKVFAKILFAASLIYILVFGITSSIRLEYPFELEWMEGGMSETVQRAIDGKQIYTAPTPDFIPFIYTPLFYHISAFVCKITTLEPIYAMRILSIVSCWLVLLLIYKLSLKFGADKVLSVSAAGLFAALYPIAEGWYDIARNDTMQLMFLLLSFYLLMLKKQNYMVLSAIAAAAAFFTKQSSSTIIAAIAISAFFINKRYFFIFTLVAGSLITFGSILMETLSEGWFSFYVFKIPSAHHLILRHAAAFYYHGLFKPMLIILILCSIGIYYIFRKRIYKELTPFLIFAIGSGLSSTLLVLHEGGWFNGLFPIYAAIVIFTAVFISKIEIDRNKKILLIALSIQFVLLAYNPLKLIPNDKDREEGFRLVKYIGQIEGEVWLPSHPLIARKSGKKPMAHQMATIDILKTDNPEAVSLKSQFVSNLKAKKFALIIDNEYPAADSVSNYYHFSGKFFKENVFICKTGLKTRPDNIFEPK